MEANRTMSRGSTGGFCELIVFIDNSGGFCYSIGKEKVGFWAVLPQYEQRIGWNHHREEYDRWRYHYPEYDKTQKWAKVPSKEISDMLVEE